MELINRFKEPSSWAVIGTALTSFGFNLDAGLLQGITYAGAAIACLLGFFLKEKPKA